jgi:DHA1 family multidrug resistance protein-like MFS transporter
MVGRFVAPLVGGLLIFGDNFRWVYVADGIAGILALLAALRLPLATNTSGSAWKAFRERRGRYGQEIKFIFRHGGILATSGIEAAQYFAFGAIETFLPIFLSEKKHYATWQIGLLFTAQILAAALTKPIMGKLSDKYGRVPMIVSGLLLGAAATALVVVSPAYLLTMGLIAVFGLGLATVTASTSAMVADLSRAEGRGLAMGVLSSIMDVGQSTGPMVTGLLVASFSYEPAFAAIGIGLAVISVAYAVGMRRHLP